RLPCRDGYGSDAEYAAPSSQVAQISATGHSCHSRHPGVSGSPPSFGESLPNIAPQALTPPASICAAPLGARSKTPSATLRSPRLSGHSTCYFHPLIGLLLLRIAAAFSIAAGNSGVAARLGHVGFRGKSGKHLLNPSLSGCDPKRT